MDRYVSGENVLFVKACAQWKKNCLKTASYDKKKAKIAGNGQLYDIIFLNCIWKMKIKKTSPVYFNKENKEWM